MPLDPAEVACSWQTVVRHHRPSAGQSRALNSTEATLSLEHRPTGLRVSRSVPAGNYSKKELQRLKAELHEILVVELEKSVKRQARGSRSGQAQKDR